MGHGFQEWLSCPKCRECEAVSMLAYKTEIVIECYECGLISEYVISDDLPLQDLDINAVAENAEEQSSDLR